MNFDAAQCEQQIGFFMYPSGSDVAFALISTYKPTLNCLRKFHNFSTRISSHMTHFSDVAVVISSSFLTFSTMFTSPPFFSNHSHIKAALTFSKITITLLGYTHTQRKWTRKLFLPPANEVAGRSCFYTRLSFSSPSPTLRGRPLPSLLLERTWARQEVTSYPREPPKWAVLLSCCLVFLWSLSLLDVNRKLNFLGTLEKATSLSLRVNWP